VLNTSGQLWLQGFGHMARANAAGAHLDGLDTAVTYRLDFLQVRVPGFGCFIVGVADVVAEIRPLTTNFAYFCHIVIPFRVG
jgi:hypothetical protein